jgi:hypothetical protein
VKIVCDGCGQVTNARVLPSDQGVRLVCGACGFVHLPETDGAAADPAQERDDEKGGAHDGLVPSLDPGWLGLAEVAGEEGGANGEGAEEGGASRGEGAPEPLPPVKCPKCGHRQYDEEHCARCGLVFALVKDGRRPWEHYPPELQPHVDRAWELWRDVEASTRASARHAAFVDHCRAHDLLGFAAMRYRHHLADAPSDPVASEYLGRVVRDAQARVQIHAEPEDFTRTARQVRNVLLVVVFLFCLIATVFVLRVFRMTSMGV